VPEVTVDEHSDAQPVVHKVGASGEIIRLFAASNRPAPQQIA
jgi:hypothetical protein